MLSPPTPFFVWVCVSFPDSQVHPANMAMEYLNDKFYLSIVPSLLLVTKLIPIHFPECHKINQNCTVALPTLQCLCRIFISVCQRPRVQTIGGPDDIWLPSSPGILATVLISALFIKTDDARYNMLSAAQSMSRKELAETPGVL